VGLEKLEAASFLRSVAVLVREEPRGDLSLGMGLDRRPVSIGDRDEDVPIRPAVAMEARYRAPDLQQTAAGDLVAEDRPMVPFEQADELVVAAPAGLVEIEDCDRTGHR